jgi:hypothetical protein
MKESLAQHLQEFPLTAGVFHTRRLASRGRLLIATNGFGLFIFVSPNTNQRVGCLT